jgi:hypothetical protein
MHRSFDSAVGAAIRAAIKAAAVRKGMKKVERPPFYVYIEVRLYEYIIIKLKFSFFLTTLNN